MKIKGITDECFSDYKLPAMFIAFPSCTFKCDQENGEQRCQNCSLIREPDIEVTKEALIERFLANPITDAIVCGGLEPFDSITDLVSLVDCMRRVYKNDAPIIIYTGYTEDEIISGAFMDNPSIGKSFITNLLQQSNIVIKYGRFRPDQPNHFDEVLGVTLTSPNQYAKPYNVENLVSPQKD